jgi:hypothetical protein
MSITTTATQQCRAERVPTGARDKDAGCVRAWSSCAYPFGTTHHHHRYLTLDDDVLRICTGVALKPHYNGPQNIAAVGKNHHTPADPSGLLFEHSSTKFKSLQELFCVAEGLLRTL